MKLARGSVLVVASHNPGKVREIDELLAPFGIVTRSAAELHLPEPEETGSTFAENAALKARAAAKVSGLPALSDDSGLAVAALGGAPGIYSARWAGPGKDFAVGMARIERELKQKNASDYSAKFVCALALAQPDGEVEIFDGEVHGHLEFPPRGNKGFGYDPIFVPEAFTQTFGEIDPAQKHAMSHRARAFAKFVCALALASPDGTVEIFEGEVHGHLEFPPRGDKGFGYDPIFVAQGMSRSFGEIEPADKHAISHRARAFEKFARAVIAP